MAPISEPDAGPEWIRIYPDGLFGAPPEAPVPPMSDFSVDGPDGLARHPPDLYDGTPTVLFMAVNQLDSKSTQIVDDLQDVHWQLEALGLKVIVDADTYPSAAAEWMMQAQTDFEIWADDPEEIKSYYGMPGTGTVILGPEGYVVLQYDFVIGQLHVDELLSDCQLLFGSGR